jgi:hypothetical protein
MSGPSLPPKNRRQHTDWNHRLLNYSTCEQPVRATQASNLSVLKFHKTLNPTPLTTLTIYPYGHGEPVSQAADQRGD